jgi:hypothetical protein
LKDAGESLDVLVVIVVVAVWSRGEVQLRGTDIEGDIWTGGEPGE